MLLFDLPSLKGPCRLCPRACGADREKGALGRCGAGKEILVARAAPHLWEEPCICTEKGSGTVFFSGCSLGCVYCQNAAISSGAVGKTFSPEELSRLFLKMEDLGVCNLNLVTAGHYAPEVAWALRQAKREGLTLPVVYNTSGYETVEALRLFRGLVDVYLPDYKYSSAALAEKYSHAPDYPQVVWQAVEEMVRQTGEPVFQSRMLLKGTLVRILLLPGCLIDAKMSLKKLFSQYGNRICYSLMRQYTPMPGIKERYPELDRKVSASEYMSLLELARQLGILYGFTQEGEAAEESFIPPFAELSFPI